MSYLDWFWSFIRDNSKNDSTIEKDPLLSHEEQVIKSTNYDISSEQSLNTVGLAPRNSEHEPNPVNGYPSKKLNIRLDETGQLVSDRILLEDVLRILMEYLGEDQVPPRALKRS